MVIRKLASSILTNQRPVDATKPDANAVKPDTTKTNTPQITDAGPQNLGDYVAKNGGTVEDLQKDKYKLASAARELLKAKGIDSPTESQLVETQFQLNESIAQGKWKTFAAPFTPSIVKVEDNINQRLGNIFFEKHAFSEADLQPDRLKLGAREQQKLRGDFESGRAGMIQAATFISARHRAEGDFSRAYGDDAWRGFMRATTHLDSVPKGQFLEKLDLELVVKTNELIHAPDEGMKAQLLRGLAYVGRGGRWDKGGEIRAGRQFARPDLYTSTEIEALKEAGVKVVPVGTKDSKIKAMLEYPAPEVVKEKLQGLIDNLKVELAKPDADPIFAASQFQRHLVALHPFGDSNGRTSRALMNRILSEYDLPPAILRDQNRDISLTPQEWRRQVAEGCARAQKFLTSARLESKDTYLSKVGVQALEKSPDKPVVLDGIPYDLGIDGFLYDATGRPSLVLGGEVVPLSQLEHFIVSRRIGQMGKEAGNAKLLEVTADTRALFDNVTADPKAGEKVPLRPDQDVRTADMKYGLKPEPEVAKLMADLAKIENVDAAKLFKISSARGTDASSTISKHSQVDLEFWYLERGLRDGGFKDLANGVREEREKLFGMAKEALASAKDPARVSPENPQGFKFEYERLMFENSPLTHDSLAQSIQKDGDGKVAVWRGDYSFAKLIGMAPNNDIRQPDAKAVAKDRAEKNQVTNLYDDLMKLEGSAVGRQYLCMTSDLALLVGAFADSRKSQTVNLGSLPSIISDAILGWVAPEKGANLTADERRKAIQEVNDARKAQKLDPLPEDGSKQIKDKFGVPGTLLSMRIAEKGTKKVEVTAERKAFMLRLDKDALLPGVVTLGGHSFESEQEMHGLERVYPWHIKSAFTADTLKKELPVIDGSDEKSTDASADAVG